MLTESNIIEESVRIPGPGRELEGLLVYPAADASCSALIAGPHPYLGGDMRNNVVSSLLKTLASQGSVALAFNYGGVGASEGGPADWPSTMSAFWKDGAFKEEDDWVDDVGSAMTALKQWCDLPQVLIGYSFGCWAVARHLRETHIEAVVFISPNPSRHDFAELSACPAPLLLIHSDNDFTCSVPDMVKWSESIREPKTRVQLPASEHFFRGHESVVATSVLEFLQQNHLLGSERREQLA